MIYIRESCFLHGLIQFIAKSPNFIVVEINVADKWF